MIQDSQSKQQEYELQRKFNKQEFVTVVGQLLQSMKIINNFDISDIYDKILTEKGKVIGKDIIDTVQRSQQLNQQQRYISEEIEFYREEINKLMVRGITCITLLEFSQCFEKNFVDGILTNEIKKKIKNYDYISLARLLKVIDAVQQQKKLIIKQSIKISNLEKSNIFHQSYFQTIPELNVRMVIEYINEIVYDAGIRNNARGMLLQIENKITSLEQSNVDLQEVENTLRKSLEEFDDELYKTYRIVDEKQAEIDRLKGRVKQLQEELIDLNKQYQDEVVNYLKNMEVENDKLRKELASSTVKNQEYQTKLDWFKSNYEGLTKEYEEFMMETRTKNEKEKKEKQEKMFIQRTIKQQLEDSLAKITILRNENIELKQKHSDIIFIYENKITSLEQKINQHQNVKQHQTIKLEQSSSNMYFRNSRLNSALSKISKISVIENNDKQRDKINKQPQSIQQTRASLLNIYKSNNFEGKFKKKQTQIISIGQSVMMSQLFDDQFEQQDQQKPKQLIQQQLEDTKQNDMKSMNKKITSLGFTISVDGARSQIYLDLFEDRFCFNDNKGRINNQITLKQLSKIVFCYYNTSWIVLKIKPNQVNKKKQKICDMVISIINRQDILEFLHLRSWRILLAEGVKIKFEQEDRVWIKSTNNQMLLSNFPNAYNLNRISINNAGYIFQGSINENETTSWFRDNIVNLVVTNIGILVFEKDNDNQFQRNQKLLKIIPIVEFMTLENPSKYEIIIRYKSDKEIRYKLKLSSYFLTKKLKNILEVFYRRISEKKQKEIQRYAVFADAIDKNCKNQ